MLELGADRARISTLYECVFLYSLCFHNTDYMILQYLQLLYNTTKSIPLGAKDCGYRMALHKTKWLILLTFNINATNKINKKLKKNKRNHKYLTGTRPTLDVKLWRLYEGVGKAKHIFRHDTNQISLIISCSTWELWLNLG